jgi:acetyltransferase-like isoleucine patch superfamily enzyme
LKSGITVGDHAIIGAGSVVIKNVLPETIVVGNPAKLINKVEV